MASHRQGILFRADDFNAHVFCLGQSLEHT
jgi:hypothetical protein